MSDHSGDLGERLSDAGESARREATRADHHRRVHRVLQHILEHLAEPLDLAALGRVAGFAPAHLGCVFRGLVGESLHQHVRRLRLERAAFLLRTTEESVKAVSLACVFDSQEAFTRAFGAAFGRPPGRFRRRPDAPGSLLAPTDWHYRPDGPAPDFCPAPDLGGRLAVRLVEWPPVRLACVRHTGPYDTAYRAWLWLLAWAWRRRRLTREARFIGLNYDDDEITPAARQRYEAGIAVEDDFRGEGGVVGHTLSGGLFAQTTVVGTYDDFARAWEAFVYQWLPASGLALRAWYGVDVYHPPPHLFGRPVRLVNEVRRRVHVDLMIPVMPGPFGRSLLA